MRIKKIEWTTEQELNEGIRYNHVTADTPFGGFLITWKGWDDNDSPTIDETPWGDMYGCFSSVEEAKEFAEKEYINRLSLCYEIE